MPSPPKCAGLLLDAARDACTPDRKHIFTAVQKGVRELRTKAQWQFLWSLFPALHTLPSARAFFQKSSQVADLLSVLLSIDDLMKTEKAEELKVKMKNTRDARAAVETDVEMSQAENEAEKEQWLHVGPSRATSLLSSDTVTLLLEQSVPVSAAGAALPSSLATITNDNKTLEDMGKLVSLRGRIERLTRMLAHRHLTLEQQAGGAPCGGNVKDKFAANGHLRIQRFLRHFHTVPACLAQIKMGARITSEACLALMRCYAKASARLHTYHFLHRPFFSLSTLVGEPPVPHELVDVLGMSSAFSPALRSLEVALIDLNQGQMSGADGGAAAAEGLSCGAAAATTHNPFDDLLRGEAEREQ
jgi:hypothetical protein